MNTMLTDSSPRQSNHEVFHIPENIKHMGAMPLYKSVAWWGYLLEGEFTREELCHAFHIDPRRASGIINYLCHRIHDDSIQIQTRKISRRRGNRALCLRVLSVR